MILTLLACGHAPLVPMAPCPSSPNCVNSLASPEDTRHHIEPLLQVDSEAWTSLQQSVLSMPRTEAVTTLPDYLHVTATTAFFGFTDDVELRWDPTSQRVDLRSASRVGYGDGGVNRTRIETLRTTFETR